MKKTVISLLCLLAIGQAEAQNNVRLPQRPNRPAYVDHHDLDNGFWCAIEANGGSSLMFKDFEAQRAGATITGGYMVNEYLKLGVGLGANYYFNNNDRLRDTGIKWTMPIFFDVRGNMMSQESRNFVPYWSLDVGAAIRDGLFFSPTVGMRFGEKRDSWLLGLSYTLQQIKNHPKSTVEGSPDHTPEMVSFFALKVGYEF